MQRTKMSRGLKLNYFCGIVPILLKIISFVLFSFETVQAWKDIHHRFCVKIEFSAKQYNGQHEKFLIKIILFVI